MSKQTISRRKLIKDSTKIIGGIYFAAPLVFAEDCVDCLPSQKTVFDDIKTKVKDTGFYNNGHYGNGYYDSGYYGNGYYCSGYYDTGYYGNGYYCSGYYDSGYYGNGYYK